MPPLADDPTPGQRRTLEFYIGPERLPPEQVPPREGGAAVGGAIAADSAATGSTTSRAAVQAEDREGAVRVVFLSLVVAAVAAGVIEWREWQVTYATAGPATSLPAAGVLGVPWGPWFRGLASTLSNASGAGALLGFATLLLPVARRRPWRSVAMGFAIGVGVLLASVALLSSLG